MGLKKGPFVVADTVSVADPYNGSDPDVISLPIDGTPQVVATVDVCVTQPQKTQVSLDSMAQIAVVADTSDDGGPITFEVTYEIQRNGEIIATINDEMDYQSQGPDGRHTNFPNFPILDCNPSAGINTYDLRCTRVTANEVNVEDIFVASRSLKAVAKGPFVVSDTVSTNNAYGGKGVIDLLEDGDSAIVASVEVCVTQPLKTQISLNSMAQIALVGTSDGSATFEVTYELLRNDNVIATINDEMDYASPNFQRHTNFPNFPIVDKNPSNGINKYDLRATRVVGTSINLPVFVSSRSLKATVFIL
ncbi:hypothetical protein [Chengkuizengella marina]|uniref:Uncharacterized protein n=1 Tax=Chengkuizengella marina TaxID=2507566 RepID=A0A6N9Q7Z6_9BACL|nr:hypothetical protein [Chengkuizengella marina]NBI30972.1 hypothetical protein [Chengkuizengella marina]